LPASSSCPGSFDARWVYYSYFHDVEGRNGADVYKVHVASKKTVRLTNQQWTPNTGVPGVTKLPKGVYNLHPCPLPGGRVAFVSNRDGLKSPRLAPSALQLFVMDDPVSAPPAKNIVEARERNVEKIGFLNVGQALHPVVLKDGRIIFSSLEVQGKHNTGWGILGIHPDGTNWDPVVSALSLGGAPIPFHFQTQLSDGSIIVENYYIPAMGGFGVYFKQPPRPPVGTPPFASAKPRVDPKMAMMYSTFRMPFQPYGMEVLTRFTHNHDSAALRADPMDPKSPHTGWVTHPCGAPDNHLLTVWTGLVHQGRVLDNGYPAIDSGIYLIKDGKPFWEPGDMLLIKNDPNYNEQWPRPLVTYRRTYGVDEPAQLPSLANDGALPKHLPAGTPFGLVGTSSLYKRETAPLGEVPNGGVTAIGSPYSAFPTREHRTNWDGQGADAGLYSNSDIHAIRILAMEPPSLVVAGKFSNHAGERLRILGEIPVRHFPSSPLARKVGEDQGKQPLDSDGNPDTSFLAKIPADVAWTFQTLDKHGMVLNMAQTWHQIRPGEIRNNCGGCHAHSQKPTPFEGTAAARPDYVPFDLTSQTPLITTKNDQSGKRWDVKDETGLRFVKGVLNVEYHRDIKPIFARSCVACHSGKTDKPAGGLVLDDESRARGQSQTGTYRTLVHPDGLKATRYIWPSQSRNSYLAWKVFGRRMDGFPEKLIVAAKADHSSHLVRGGIPYAPFEGSIMPPPDAVKSGKVAALSDEDRRMIVRWIDLGRPIDHDFDPKEPDRRGNGWMLDDQRPTLTLTCPRPGANPAIDRILIGFHDYDTGIDLRTLTVTADFAVDDAKAGENLATRLKEISSGVFELPLTRPITKLVRGTLTVTVRDRQGNTTRIERTFSVGASR